MINIDDALDDLIDQELNTGNVNKYISSIHPELDLKYNSLNICVGKRGASKTTTFMKNMIKLCQFPNNVHGIVCK